MLLLLPSWAAKDFVLEGKVMKGMAGWELDEQEMRYDGCFDPIQASVWLVTSSLPYRVKLESCFELSYKS